MKVVVQRVSQASVTVNGRVVGSIGQGLLVLLGIKKDDTKKQQDYLINKILNLRIFPNGDLNFDKNVVAVGGQILLVSQFTLYGNCLKGNRPSFYDAMLPDRAKIAYESFAEALKKAYPQVEEGIFGAVMSVKLINNGPVTVIIEH